jgi:flagellar assembly protein FliH
VHGDAVTEGALDGLADSIRSKARAQGYSVGWAQGRRQAVLEARQQQADREAEAEAAEKLRAAEHAEALTALRLAAQALHEQAAVVAARVEDAALELARELTRTLVGHDLRTTPDPAGDTVRRALTLLPEPDDVPVTLRLHPDVAAAPASDDLRTRGVRVVADASLDTCDAVVETDDAVVDARVSVALGRVLEVLS